MIRHTRKLALSAALCMLTLTGCATKGDIEALRAEISALQQTNNEALVEAKGAKELASAAHSEFKSIKSTADSAARQAQQNELLINKAFEQSLKK